MASDLENKIIHQIEYYFGDINLPRDKFMKEKLKEDEGWIAIDVLLTFKRLASLSKDAQVIINAMQKADSGLVEVNEEQKKLRRNTDLPIPELNDERKKELMARTAYVKGFPTEEELTPIMTFLEEYGSIESCFRRLTKQSKFKGSCFVIFKDVEQCKKFIEQENVKYKETELIRKWQEEYFKEKKKEYEERIQKKKDTKAAKLEAEKKSVDLPKGAIIHFSEIPEGNTLTWEEVKEKIQENDGFQVAFIDFRKGDLEGYIRLSKENSAAELIEKIGTEIEVSNIKLKLRALQGEEEETFLNKTVDTVIKIRNKQKQGSKKRKGKFSNSNGRFNKSKKIE